MKKRYIAPTLEVELYELDANIALHCQTIVDNGPAVDGHAECDLYTKWEQDNGPTTGFINKRANASSRVNFYENCDCYYTAANAQFWTS